MLRKVSFGAIPKIPLLFSLPTHLYRIAIRKMFRYMIRIGGVGKEKKGPSINLSSCSVCTREVVYMERPLKPNMEPSLADVLLCTFESTNAGFSSFPVRKLLS